jgi:hypothetical protein
MTAAKTVNGRMAHSCAVFIFTQFAYASRIGSYISVA